MSRSSTTTDLIPIPTPGETLIEDVLTPLGLSQNALARALRIDPRRINEIVLGKRAISADTDLRLSRYLGTSPGFWLRLQADYDLRIEQRRLRAELRKITPRAA
jgi:addiction module HigA family antidote